jgi:peptide-methionine (S)-S-oxide reductase
MIVAERHYLNDRPLKASYAGAETLYLGMGCFWGAERLLWRLPGVIVTAVGYQGGVTPNPTYDEVCSGRTGHTETVRIVFDPAAVPVERLLKTFFEEHDPTQGMRQGEDVGSQYRSAIYATSSEQAAKADAAFKIYDRAYRKNRAGPLTTEVKPAGPFYYAETHHQQYLAKNPAGYCGLEPTGVRCPLPANGREVAAQ